MKTSPQTKISPLISFMAIGHNMSHSFVSVMKGLLSRVWENPHTVLEATHTVCGEGPAPTFLRPPALGRPSSSPNLPACPSASSPRPRLVNPFMIKSERAHDTYSKHKGHAPWLQDMCYSHRTCPITEEMYRTCRLTMGNVL